MAPGENNKATMDLASFQDDDTSVNTKNMTSDRSEDDYSDEPDESLSERLWGLTEMFPEPVRKVTSKITNKTVTGIKCLYGLSRNVVWFAVSSSVILFAPLIFEIERAQMEDLQRSKQKQMLLGPTSAAPSGPGVPMPPIQR